MGTTRQCISPFIIVNNTGDHWVGTDTDTHRERALTAIDMRCMIV